MGIVKKIILLPFLPLRLAWKWSSEAKINGEKNIFAHLIGFVILTGIMYGLIGVVIETLVGMFNK